MKVVKNLIRLRSKIGENIASIDDNFFCFSLFKYIGTLRKGQEVFSLS